VSRRLASAGLTAAALILGACSPGAPKGVEKAALDAAVTDAVGDPNTCVLIGQAGSGRLVYRYGTYGVCDRDLPSCAGVATRKTGDLLKATAASKRPLNASCPSTADGSRGVAWAAAPVASGDLVYAASMEGEHTPPGLVIAEKLSAAFAKAGLQPR